MTQHNAQELQEKILAFLKRYPTETFKSKELARRLGIRDEKTYQRFKEQLRFLQDKGAILRLRGKKYAHLYQPEIVRGILRRTRNGAIVTVSDTGEEITLAHSEVEEAYDGDVVEISVYPQTEKQKKRGKPREGELLRILERPVQTIVGIVEQVRKQYVVIPVSKNLSQEISVSPAALNGAREGEKVVVELLPSRKRHGLPEGRVVEILGKPGKFSTELTAVVHEFHLPLSFPAEVLAEAEALSATISAEEIARRKDFRNSLTFTIDPEDAKDFDDALSIKKRPDGAYDLAVHIADVSHYVQEGSALDKEALKRGTSVYLPNGVIPMLPERLSNNLCSLRPDEDRLTYSVCLTVSPLGAVKNYTIVESIIRSKRRFSYEEVQEILDRAEGGKSLPVHAEPFRESLQHLRRLSATLTKKRLREGSIDFETEEVKFKFDEKGKPVEIVKKVRLASHRLVEECMLLANRVVARHIGLPKEERHPQPFLYRVHDAPDPQRVVELARFVKKFGFSLNVEKGVSSKELQRLLDAVKGSEVENIINEIVLRSMAKAVYSENNIGHYGLGFDYYSHFTSPIRRYPDLVVHRMLKRYHAGVHPHEREKLRVILPAIAKQSSERERVAMEAERTAVKVVQVEYMKNHLGDEFAGVISGVAPYGIFVQLSDILVEGMVHVREMMDDYYTYDEKQYALVGRSSKKVYRLGDVVRVKLIRINAEDRQLDFSLVTE